MSATADEPTAIASSAASTFGISTLQILGNQVSLQQLTPVGPIAFWGGGFDNGFGTNGDHIFIIITSSLQIIRTTFHFLQNLISRNL